MSTAEYNPFLNVRVGGPKEKRIRSVELMGEHKPKVIFYIKVTQKELNEENITLESLQTHFERIGQVGDIYRPNGPGNVPKEFAFVGFYDPAHVKNAINSVFLSSTIEGKVVSVEEAKTWVLELYPRG